MWRAERDLFSPQPTSLASVPTLTYASPLLEAHTSHIFGIVQAELLNPNLVPATWVQSFILPLISYVTTDRSLNQSVF